MFHICATQSGMPLSSVSSNASSAACASMASDSFQSRRARSAGDVVRHALCSSARRAALTAASISAASPAAACAKTSPLAGSKTSNTLPEAAGRHLPPISSWRGRPCRLSFKDAFISPLTFDAEGRLVGEEDFPQRRWGAACDQLDVARTDLEIAGPERTLVGHHLLTRPRSAVFVLHAFDVAARNTCSI